MKKLITLLFLMHSFFLIKGQSTWSELGGLNSLSANTWIYSICSDAVGNIYAAGGFINSSANFYVAKYDGVNWIELGGSNSLAANRDIHSICSDALGNIYAAGIFTNGSNYLNGNRYVAKYNGIVWSEVGSLNGLSANSYIWSICSDNKGNIYAAGDFKNSSAKRYVAKYNGTTWSELGGLNGLSANNLISAICSDKKGNIYVAGDFTNSSGKWYVAKYNGTTWSELGGLNALSANFSIYSICSDSAGNIYATGAFTNSSGKYYVAKYDGISWSELGGLNGLSANNALNSIFSDAGKIYVAGEFTNASGNKYVARYNGTIWNELGGLNALAGNNTISTICSDSAGNFYTAGWFSNSNGKRYVAKYGCISTKQGITATICSGSYFFNGNNLTTSGSYNDTLINYNGCDSILTLTLSVNPIPVIDITATQNLLCLGGEDTLIVSGAGTYQWIPFTLGTNDTLFVSPNDTIKYYVQGTTNGCSDYDSITINVNTCPTGTKIMKSLNKVMVAPNPCSICEIKTTSNLAVDFQVTDLLGRIVLAQFEKTTTGYLIIMPTRITGIYFIKNTKSGEVVRFVMD